MQRILPRRPTRVAAAAAAVVLALAGCATAKGAAARESALASEFQAYPFPRSCDAIWPDALRVAQKRGFALSAKDRALVGESPDGFVAQLVSAATQTYRTSDGGLTASTDWNRESGTRLRVTGSPADPKDAAKGCRVRYDVVAGGVTTADEVELGPDWSYDLDLLAVVDPAAAAAVEGRVPAPK